MSDITTWDLIVVGGGAAGFFAAIELAEARPDAKVLILEKARKVLQKVRVSGGGRCNVTHDCFDPRRMATHYPRGHRALIGPLHRFGVAETVDWFARRDVALKTEEDGRMFPTTDDSRTVIECLNNAARKAGVQVRTATTVRAIHREDDGFTVLLDGGERLTTPAVLLATGGTRSRSGARLAESLGHSLVADVPSLFTFDITDARLDGLPGLSVDPVGVSSPQLDLKTDGPLLITHKGLSGPAVLKFSAWGARELHDLEYRFDVVVDWLPGVNLTETLQHLRRDQGARQITTRSPFDAIPRRLWRRLAEAAGVHENLRWAELPGALQRRLEAELQASTFAVLGKSTNKDEFVTCGGVATDDVDMRTMESRRCPGLFFAGEILDIDGVTGGFNFQNAWTTGHLAAQAIALREPTSRD